MSETTNETLKTFTDTILAAAAAAGETHRIRIEVSAEYLQKIADAIAALIARAEAAERMADETAVWKWLENDAAACYGDVFDDEVQG